MNFLFETINKINPKTLTISKSKFSKMERIIAAFNLTDKQTTGIISKPIDIFLPREKRLFLKGLGLLKKNFTKLTVYLEKLSL